MRGELSGPGIFRRGVALAATVAVLGGACSTESHHSAESSTIGSTTSVAPPTTVEQSCIEPTPSDLEAVDRLLATPEAAVYSETTRPDRQGEEIDEDIRHFDEQTARNLGLTIIDGFKLAGKLSDEGIKSATPLPFQTVFSPAKEFASQFGISLEVGKSDEEYGYGGHAPDAKELASGSAQESLTNLIYALSDAPKEYFELAGLKRVVLVAGTEKEDVGGYAVTDAAHDTMYIDVTQSPNASFPEHGDFHEIYHLLDDEECGSKGMANDSRFNALKGAEDLYNGDWDDSRYPNLDTYTDDFLREGEQYQISAENRDTKTFCGIVKKINQEAEQVETYSSYHPNVMEDKAELGAEIADNNAYYDLTDSHFTILNRKFRFLLARLYHQAPNLVKYFTKVAMRPSPLSNAPGLPKC